MILFSSLLALEMVADLLTGSLIPRQRISTLTATVFCGLLTITYLGFYWAMIIKYHTSDPISYVLFGLAGTNLVAIGLYLFRKANAVRGPLALAAGICGYLAFLLALGIWALLRRKKLSRSRLNAWNERRKARERARGQRHLKLPARSMVFALNTLLLIILAAVALHSSSGWVLASYSWPVLIVPVGLFLLRHRLSRYMNWHSDRNIIVPW